MAKRPLKQAQQMPEAETGADRHVLLLHTGTLLRELEKLLQDPAPGPDEIHAIRLACKRLRAWIRLIRHAGNNRKWLAPDRELRAIARHFGGRRDAQVMADTLAKMRRRNDEPKQRRRLAMLQKALQAQTMPDYTATPHPHLSEGTHTALLRLPASLQPAAGLARSRTRTVRTRDKLAAGKASADALHAWRKQVKYLGYQLDLCSTSAERSPEQRSCARLGKLLGRIQDLTQLRRHVRTLTPDPALAKAVHLARQLAARERRKLVRLVLRPNATRALRAAMI